MIVNMKRYDIKERNDSKLYFKILKTLTSIVIHKPNFIYLGDKVTYPSIILVNHEGSRTPLTLELYFKEKNRMLGTYEMNGSLKDAYKYLSETYYHNKKKWPLFLSKLFCLIAAPLTCLYYRGLNLISVYSGVEFFQTVKEAYKCVNDYKKNLIIYPEDSSKGYFAELTHFFSGFVIIAHYMYQRGIDLNIYVSYFNPKTKNFIFDKPVKYSEVLKYNLTKEELAKKFLIRCNELGKMSTNKNLKNN